MHKQPEHELLSEEDSFFGDRLVLIGNWPFVRSTLFIGSRNPGLEFGA